MINKTFVRPYFLGRWHLPQTSAPRIVEKPPRKPNKKTVRFSPVKRRSGASTQTKWKMTTPRSAPRNSFGVHFPFRLSVGNFPFFAPFKNLIRPAQGSFKPIHFPKFRLVKFKKNILNHHLPETPIGASVFEG